MLRINWKAIRIFIRTGATDMRKQIGSLSIMVREEFKTNPCDGNLYMFCGTHRHTIKILYWDRNGFCLWTKKCTTDSFPWPLSKNEVKEIDRKKWKYILDGIDFWKAHQEKKYDGVI
jgi:transposase